jgi:(p)ppGpp synthase/HD superfamily hydrolase
MRGKDIDFAEVYDVRAVRIIVDEVKDCYTALGIVHHLWQPIHGEFDDYISHPKGNFYRSLHTAVEAEDGRSLEVQIRTREMHEHAELGVAATGATRNPAASAKAAAPTRTRFPGCGSCSRGATKSPIPPNGCSSSSAPRWMTRFTC